MAIHRSVIRNDHIPAFTDIACTEVRFAMTTDRRQVRWSESPYKYNPVAAALANAVADATSICLRTLPLRPVREPMMAVGGLMFDLS